MTRAHPTDSRPLSSFPSRPHKKPKRHSIKSAEGHGRLGRVENGSHARQASHQTKEHADAHRRCLQLVEAYGSEGRLCSSLKIQK